MKSHSNEVQEKASRLLGLIAAKSLSASDACNSPELSELCELVSEQKALISNLRDDISSQERNFDSEKQKLLKKLSRAEKTALKMRNSHSWRLTAPYRHLGKILGFGTVDKSPPSSTASHPGQRSDAQSDSRPHQHANTGKKPARSAHRILVADYRAPRTSFSAGEEATLGILEDLRSFGYEVVFLSERFGLSDGHEADLESLGISVVDRSRDIRTPFDYIRAHAGEFCAYYLIRDYVAKSFLPLIREVAPEARVICHLPDLRFLRALREAEIDGDETALAAAYRTRRSELSVADSSDHVVTVSNLEAEIVRASLPAKTVSVFPVLYAPVNPNPRPFQERANIFFLGGFGHRPNGKAVQWFARNVWPLVRKKLPAAEFHVIGSEPPSEVLALEKIPGVKVRGFVPDLSSVLDTMRVGVAPLLFGAGIKGKLAVTMGAGIPCVSTPIAAEGMGIESGTHGLIADDVNSFAEATVELYTDEALWNRLSANGSALVQSKYSPQANRASLLKVLYRAGVLAPSLLRSHYNALEWESLPAPKANSAPDVSIIVSCLGAWSHIKACIASIIETSGDASASFEILCTGVGSEQEKPLESLTSYARFISSDKPRTCLQGWNEAARCAKGRYLLFLDGESLALPGFLDDLYKSIDEDESAAIVGPALRSSHSAKVTGGAVIASDGTILQVESPSELIPADPKSNSTPAHHLFRREVDCVSPHCMIVRKSFWHTAGGVDEQLAPAYAAADLAVEARSQGMHVYFDPAPELLHDSKRSPSPHPSHKASPAEETADKRLFASKRHQELVSEHLPPGTPRHSAAAHAERRRKPLALKNGEKAKANILYFSPFPSHPGNHGNQATIQRFGKCLQSLGHNVHFVLMESCLFGANDERAMRNSWTSVDILPFTQPSLPNNGEDIPFDAWYVRGLGETVRSLCARYEIGIAICSYVFHSQLLEYLPANILKVIDTHDKMGNRFAMLRREGLPLEFFSCTPEDEGRYLRRADVVIARRAEEARYFDQVAGWSRAVVVPHFEEPMYITRPRPCLRNVGIVASANLINLGMVRDFVASACQVFGGDGRWPFTLHIAGRVKDLVATLPIEQQQFFNHPSIVMHGYTPDISQFYRDMDLITSPVTIGTGINVKTVQALAYGMPLISTKFGSKGVDTADPMHNHESLVELVRSIARTCRAPHELDRLAAASRATYDGFYAQAVGALHSITTVCR